ncbi:MAG: hypothetical protein F6K56_21290 [Moorea sp. SIO3G5]|nr:hypothetical protein [Moorena sp. SIO3G5]
MLDQVWLITSQIRQPNLNGYWYGALLTKLTTYRVWIPVLSKSCSLDETIVWKLVSAQVEQGFGESCSPNGLGQF